MADDLQMMTPNAPEEMTIDMWNTAITFEKGHRIALHITSSNSQQQSEVRGQSQYRRGAWAS
jgi:predicted acyl esterase